MVPTFKSCDFLLPLWEFRGHSPDHVALWPYLKEGGFGERPTTLTLGSKDRGVRESSRVWLVCWNREAKKRCFQLDVVVDA